MYRVELEVGKGAWAYSQAILSEPWNNLPECEDYQLEGEDFTVWRQVGKRVAE